jgi:phosphoglycolate phosphatase-like HAD superfamily hydrolase
MKATIHSQMRAGLYGLCLFGVILLGSGFAALTGGEPLPSWHDRPTKQALLTFVANVSNKNHQDYVPPADRIAAFDNDGTLWAEQPVYFQLLFAVDQIKQRAAHHPEWHTTEPFASILKGDLQGGLIAGGAEKIKENLLQVITASHGTITSDEFAAAVRTWIAQAQHPTKRRPYTSLVYQPMLELIDHLHNNDFKVFIVSGGGIDFMRVFSQEVYDIPPERVIGSSVEAEYRLVDGVPTIMKLPAIHFIDDKEGKPVAIHQQIGKRPLLAAGNSDGDFAMLQWTTAGPSPRLGLIVHHTDAKREWAYDRDSHIGGLVRGLDEGPQLGWLFADIRQDWKTIFPAHER